MDGAGGVPLTQRGKSARTRAQRLTRRRSDLQGFDRGGRRRSIFKSKFAYAFYVVGLVGLLGSLVPLLILGGNDPHGSSAATGGAAPINRLEREAVDIGAVEGKPQFPTPPSPAIDLSQSFEAVLELEGGTVRIQMFADLAPVHVNNFVFLANLGFYDGISFHRVIPGFVAQGGDPTAVGTGGAGYTLQDEDVAENAAALTLGATGVIAMARSGLGASSSQFFITLAPQGSLDAQGFTAFGRVVEGMDLIQGLAPRDPSLDPNAPAGSRILRLRVLENGVESTSPSPSSDAQSDSASDSSAQSSTEG